MSVTKSSQNNLTSPSGNSLAVFVDILDSTLKIKDINGNIDDFATYLPPTLLNTGLLQIQGGVALDSTLRSVTDQNNTASTLKLSTTSAQFVSPLRITTDDASEFYLDCEDGATNNRFSITRNTASQQVNLNFASNPAGSTTTVGAIRTFRDGVNLSEVMTFREDGNVGIGTPPNSFGLLALNGALNFPKSYLNNEPNIFITTQTQPDPNNFAGTNSNTLSVGTTYVQDGSNPFDTGYGNTYLGLESSAIAGNNSYFNTIIGHTASISVSQPGNVVIGYDATSSNANTTTIGRQASVSGFEGSAIGFLATTSTQDGFAIGNVNSKLQIGGNFIPTARVHIKGSGSTSATTSLLVQNSVGANLLNIGDGGLAEFGTTGGGGGGGVNAGVFRSAYFNSFGDAFTIFENSNSNGNAFFYQNVSIGSGVTPVASAVLDVVSTTKGFLPPRMTTAQINAIVTPAEGLVAYNTTISHLCVYQSGAWAKLSHSPM